MISNKPLFIIGNSKFYSHYFLIIGILAISFSISFLIRSQGADYGFELNEFDPYFNFRATQFIVDNGILEYFEWNDDRSWHTIGGRNVSATSQVMLHLTAAILYQTFGFGSTLYDFTILFPLIFGSLTTIVIFAFVRVLGGTTAGLFASLFFAISVPIILRGMIGWFKSEPLGIFYSVLGLYLFLSGIKTRNKKIAFLKIIGGGIFFAFSLSAWGGSQFFMIPLGAFFLALPFIRKDTNFLIWAIPLFSSVFIVVSLMFERPGLSFFRGLGGFLIIAPTIFMVITLVVQKFSIENHKIRNGLIFLCISFLLGSTLVLVNPTIDDKGHNLLPIPSFRYVNAINPSLTTTDPLVDSVAEHATVTTTLSFTHELIFMIFGGIGAWLLFNKLKKGTNLFFHNDMIIFTLIMNILGVYVSSTFARLELFSSISLIVLSSIGLSIITKEIFSKNLQQGLSLKKNKKFKDIKSNSIKPATKFSYVVIVIVLLLIPITLPQDRTWINQVKGPPTILNGGTSFNIANQDWFDAMTWLKNNTHEDAVVVSWWDYGYWISTLSERISIADNATLETFVIQNIAKTFLTTPDSAWTMLNEMDGDYVLIFIAAERLDAEDERPLYILRGGGDESKKQWFIRIAEEPLEKYLAPDGFTGSAYFWTDTLLGKMFPFTPIVYVNPQNLQQSLQYVPGYVSIFEKTIKSPIDDSGPIRLVYESDSLKRTTPGPITGILIYEINKDYIPSQ